MKYPTSRLQATIRRGIFLFLLLPLPLLQAQAELSGTREEIHPLFYVDLVSFRSEKPHHSRLDIYLKIMYDDLQFTKLAADSFRAIYEVSAIISDEDDFQINGRTWRDTVIVKSFDATNSRTMFRFGETRFDLPPDKYRVSVGVTDVDTRRTAYRKSQVVVREFSKDKLSLSDVLIADGTSPDSSGLIIPHPQVAAPRREGSRLFAFFEIYDTSESKEYELSYSLKNLKGEKVFQRQAMVQHTGQITPVVAELPNHQLAHGVYLIRIDAKTDHSKAYTEREIVLHWVGIPPNIVDLDKAIEQMRYIAKKDGLKKIKSAPPEKRREAFLQFWRANDPTPGTEENELMEEYYRRIDYASANFAAFQEGWKTDRGMVYVIFGPPGDIERQPFNRTSGTIAGRTVKAYEIWNYYDINRQFIFVDESGYGDYRLAYPLTIEQYLR